MTDSLINHLSERHLVYPQYDNVASLRWLHHHLHAQARMQRRSPHRRKGGEKVQQGLNATTLRFIFANPKSSANAIEQALGYDRRQVSRILHSLLSRNLVTREQGTNGSGNMAWLYTAVPAVATMTDEDWKRVSQHGRAVAVAGVAPTHTVKPRKAKAKPTTPITGTEAKPTPIVLIRVDENGHGHKVDRLDGDFAVVGGKLVRF